MPARRKTPETKGAAERGRPTSGPTGASRAWLDDQVMYEAHVLVPTGFERDSAGELVAVGEVLRKLGGDPNALMRDAAAMALHAKCEGKGRRSTAGRKPDDQKRQRQGLGYRAVRILAEMSRAAAETRNLPEADRLGEMAYAAAQEITRLVDIACQEGIGESSGSPHLSAYALVEAREWLASHESISRALLERFPPGRRGPAHVAPWMHMETAIEMLRLLDPSPTVVFIPGSVDSLDRIRRGVAKRSTLARKRASAAREALRTE